MVGDHQHRLPRQLARAWLGGGLVSLPHPGQGSGPYHRSTGAQEFGLRPRQDDARTDDVTYKYPGINHGGIVTAAEPDALSFFAQMLPPRS